MGKEDKLKQKRERASMYDGEADKGDVDLFIQGLPTSAQAQMKAAAEQGLIAVRDNALYFGNVELSQNGITNLDELTEDDLDSAGELLFNIESAVQWWIGDWLLRIPQTWGRTIEEVALRVGKEVKTLYEYQQVASKVKIAERSAQLKWSHHREIVYRVPENEIAEWIRRAEEMEELSVRRLRAAILENRGGDEAETPAERFRRSMKTYSEKSWKKMSKEDRTAIIKEMESKLKELRRWHKQDLG